MSLCFADLTDQIHLSFTVIKNWQHIDDQDDMDNTWEVDTFGDLETATATSDFDFDGSIDYDEYMAGTDPRDPLSLLQLTHIAFRNDGTIILSWDSSTNLVPARRIYDIAQAATVEELAQGGAFIASAISSAGESTSITSSTPRGIQSFFRITLHEE